jgi:hypothetical protein
MKLHEKNIGKCIKASEEHICGLPELKKIRIMKEKIRKFTISLIELQPVMLMKIRLVNREFNILSKLKTPS